MLVLGRASPPRVLLGQADHELTQIAGHLGRHNRLGPPPFPDLLNRATIRLRRDDADHVRDVVVELLADGEQPGAVVQARDDPVAA